MDRKVSILRWDIEPYVGVGPVQFGMSREKIRAMLGDEFSTFRKGQDATNETDAYMNVGAHLYYDTDDMLECVELVGPISVNCCGVPLLDIPIERALTNLADAGLSYRYDDGYFIDECGVALYVPDGAVRAVTAYRRGYYDD
jgi:hypothetical protein